MKARICFFVLCINVSLVLLGSAHNEYGVDHDKDKLDPSYKYKMKGDEILCENIAQKKHLVGVVPFCIGSLKKNHCNTHL